MAVKIELLAPARDLATGRVAVDCGADAVYIGGPGFGARRAAGNSLADVAALVSYARPFGVRVYATLNTLLLDEELAEAETIARGLVEAGVDALIVQDMAWLRMGLSGVEMSSTRGVVPTVEFHASTQTSNIVPEDVAFLGRAGFRRVILERALSLDEIRAIRAATPQETELEVFVHGAICVGYSGRCFMSRSMGSAGTGTTRSGNRGDCSQPCRLAYDLVEGGGSANGGGRTLIKGKHLLSVRDLDLGARIGELLDAGVSSFKIEGRLKDAAYVRNVVSHYQRLLDEALAARPGLKRASAGVSVPDFVPDPAKSFTRDGSEYFLDGPRGGVASFDTPKAMGERVGTVGRVGCERTGNRFFEIENAAGRVPVEKMSNKNMSNENAAGRVPVENMSNKNMSNETAVELAAGDGICFFSAGDGNTHGELRGTNINRVEGRRIYPDKCDGITPGVEIYRNHDHAFVRTLERSRMKRRIAVAARVAMSPSKVEITLTDETGLAVTVAGEGVFEPARDPAKMAATVCEQLARSGDTIFEVRDVEIVPLALPIAATSAATAMPTTMPTSAAAAPMPTPPTIPMFVPVSMLAQMRREGLERLFEERAKLPPERRPAIEDMSVRFPREKLTAVENVTNRLAESFRCDHGVTEIAPALELRGADPGEVVMRTRYCIRREIGRCLRNGAEPCDDLFLERGSIRWRLGFDCNKCEHSILRTGEANSPSKCEMTVIKI